MEKIILAYGIFPIWRGGYSFSVYENGIVNYGRYDIDRQVIDSKRITLPQSVVYDVKN